MRKRTLPTLAILFFLQFFPAVLCFGLDSTLTEDETFYYTAYLEEPQEFGYRIFFLDPVSLLQVKTEFKGGFATLYDSPRKLQWQDGMLYFLDGSRNPNTSHQGMMYRYDPRLETLKRVCAFEAEDYTLTEDGIWIVYGGELCMVRFQTMLQQNLYKGRNLKRIESDNKHLYILEELPEGESTISFYNTGSRESRVLVRGSIRDFTLHDGYIYYCDSESSRLMKIRLTAGEDGSEAEEVLEGAASAPKFDSYGYLYYLEADGNLRAFIEDDQLNMKIADGPFLDWRPVGEYVYIAKEVERSSHFLVDMRNGNHIPLESREGSNE